MKHDTKMKELSKSKSREEENSFRAGMPGFTAIEILVVLLIVGVMAAAIFPAVMHTLETRSLDGTAREILMGMQRARFQAVKTHVDHRLRFVHGSSGWAYYIEKETTSGQWSVIQGFIKKTISSDFSVTVNLPSQEVIFSPLGFAANIDSAQNSVTIQSPSLQSYNQADSRIVSVYPGGSVRFSKT